MLAAHREGDDSIKRRASSCVIKGRKYHKFRGASSDCGPAELRSPYLRHPRTHGRPAEWPSSRRTPPHRQIEPVFANPRYNKCLDPFTLRSQRKVNTQHRKARAS